MSPNQDKIDAIFSRMSVEFGLNRSGRVHQSLLRGEITPRVRSAVRKRVASQGKNAK